MVALSIPAAGCSGPPPEDAQLFQGLDPVVVQEVLDNPVHERDISALPESTRDRGWQYTVAEMDACRDLHAAYQEWLRTGEQPKLPAWDVPQAPEPGYLELAQSAEKVMRAAYEGGDPAEVVTYLTAEGSCGTWVPAKPGDVKGPTIAKTVKSS